MFKGQHYHCEFTSGDGTNYDEGTWVITTLTANTLVVEKLTGADWMDNYNRGDAIACKRNGKGPHVLEEGGDDTFTVYPNQNGTPFVFEPAPITEGRKEPVT